MGLTIACFDIESTSLDATYGRPLCACFKFQGVDDVFTLTSPGLKDERKFLTRVRAALDSVDILVTWYGKLFDVPFLDARLMARDMAPIRKGMHLDLCLVHKYRCRTRGHHLDGVAKDLNCKSRKYEVDARIWQDAMDTGDKPVSRSALGEIVKHCEADVMLTEEVLGRMSKLITNITR